MKQLLTRKLMCAALSVLFAPGAVLVAQSRPDQATLRDTIVQHEARELDALKTGNMPEFASLIADDAVFVDPHGTAGKDEVVKNVANIKLLDYTMEDVKFLPLGPDSGLVAYRLTEKLSAQGREFTAKSYASALWVNRTGRWVCVFSQESPAK